MSTNQLENLDYKYPRIGKSKWTLIPICIFLVTLFIYFPITYKVKSILKKQLTSIPGCPLDYKDIKTEFFLPKLIVEDLSIPARCLNLRNSPDLKMKKVFLHFRGLSFSPFGPHFLLETTILKNKLSAYITTGIGGMGISIRENVFDSRVINHFVPKFRLSGKIKTDLLVKTNSDGLSDLKLNFRSNDIAIPPQSLQGFKLSTLILNDLLLKAQMKGNKLEVQDLILGDAQAPIRASFNGNIDISPRNFKNSQLDLKGEVKFSSEFLEKYAIIKLVMGKFDKRDDFYQIALKGPVTRPTPQKAR